MSFSLNGCFSPDFYGDLYEPEIEEKPTNLSNAINKLMRDQETLDNVKKEVFNLPVHVFLSEEMILMKIEETDTVSNLNSPVKVWIDKEGYYKLEVWDKKEEE